MEKYSLSANVISHSANVRSIVKDSRPVASPETNLFCVLGAVGSIYKHLVRHNGTDTIATDRSHTQKSNISIHERAIHTYRLVRQSGAPLSLARVKPLHGSFALHSLNGVCARPRRMCARDACNVVRVYACDVASHQHSHWQQNGESLFAVCSWRRSIDGRWYRH